MNFNSFLKSVPKIANLPLPGEEYHYKMAPLSRLRELREEGIKNKNPKKAAVLMLFYPDEEQRTKFVLILRKTYKGVHSNQVGFPGGKVENGDLDYQMTALRETHEEVGIRPDDINIIRPITEVYIPPSNFLVFPYLGTLAMTPEFIPQETEVEGIIEVPLADFLDDSALSKEKLDTSYARALEVPAFKLNGHTVWGATAMMLNEVKALLNKSV